MPEDDLILPDPEPRPRKPWPLVLGMIITMAVIMLAGRGNFAVEEPQNPPEVRIPAPKKVEWQYPPLPDPSEKDAWMVRVRKLCTEIPNLQSLRNTVRKGTSLQLLSAISMIEYPASELDFSHDYRRILSEKDTREILEAAKRCVHRQEVMFPVIRDATGPVLRREGWIENREARTVGKGYTTIWWTWWRFADNGTIASFHSEHRTLMNRLRFRTAKYQWSRAAQRYSSLGLEGYNDRDLLYAESGTFIHRVRLPRE